MACFLDTHGLPVQRPQFAAMFGLLGHTGAEGRFVLHHVMRVEIVPNHLVERLREPPSAGDKVTVTARHHGENKITDMCDRKIIGTPTEFHP